MNDLASQAPMIGPVISAVCAVAVVVILPLLAYIQMRRDKDIDRIVARQDDYERKATAHDVAITEVKTELKAVENVHLELRDMRSTMLTKSEFDAWTKSFDVVIKAALNRGRERDRERDDD